MAYETPKMALADMQGCYVGSTPARRWYDGGTLVYQGFGPASEQEFIQQTAAGGPAQLLKVYGKTIVNNQLVKNGDFSDGLNGWTIDAGNTASVSGGVITIPYNSIYPDGANARMSQAISLTNGHKMLVRFKIKITTQAVGRCYPGYFADPTQWFDVPRDYSYYADWKQFAAIIPLTSDKTTAIFGIYRQSGSTISPGDSVSMRDIRLIDLTLRFGAGNEPTSVDEALRLLGGDAFDPAYDPGSIQSNKAAELRADDGGTLRGSLALNLSTLTGKLNGEGASVVVYPDGMAGQGNDKDAILYGIVANVVWAKVDLGSLNYYEGFGGFQTGALQNIMKWPHDASVACNLINTRYPVIPYGGPAPSSAFCTVVYNGEGYAYNGLLVFKNTGYATAADFKASVQGLDLWYPLATPLTYTLDTPLPTDLTCEQGDILQRVSDNNCPFVGEMKFGL